MGLDSFNKCLEKLFNNDNLTKSEINDFDNYAVHLVSLLENDNLNDYDMKNSLDLYIEYYQDKERLREITKQIINTYKEVINRKEYSKPKVLRLIDNKKGAIKSIVLIEVVLIIGVLVAFLALALLKK